MFCNQLLTAKGLSYTYDANGNMTKDGLRNMNFAYNRLNLPQVVSKGSDVLAYGYSADGSKREKKFNNTVTQQYRGTIVYDGSGTPEYVLTPEGMVRNENGTWKRQYNLTDHLGNTRAVLAPNAAVLQQANYYPFGVAFGVENANKNKYLYGNKEYQDEVVGGTLFGMSDNEARFLDVTHVPGWRSIDPLCEKYYSISPYAYCANNPIFFVDPTGEDVYMYFYVYGEKDKPQDTDMFWAAAVTRAKDMLANGEIGEGDAYVIRGISDIGKLGEAVEGVVSQYGAKYGETAEFGLWSHGSLDGPRGSESTSGNYDYDDTQMTSEGWGQINFNWKEGAKAMFYGCRTASNEGGTVTPWAQKVSKNENMKDVEVWGQTKRSYPSIFPDKNVNTRNIRNNIHSGYKRYMVGGSGNIFGSARRKLGVDSQVYPMAIYKNGKFIRTRYQ